MTEPLPTTDDTLDAIFQQARAIAAQFLSGAFNDTPGPRMGELLLRLIDQVERDATALHTRIAALEATREVWDVAEDDREARLAALETQIELHAALSEDQSDTMSALLEENDALRAKLFLYERKET